MKGPSPRRLVQLLGKLRALSPEKRAALLGAVLLLPAAKLGLRLIAYRQLLGWVERLALVAEDLPASRRRPSSGQTSKDQALARARRLTAMVELAAHRAPLHFSCLERSLALQALLRGRGLASEICLGVRRDPAGPAPAQQLQAHAWVELGGEVLNDAPDVAQRFCRLTRAEPAPEQASFC